jgi:hypothetical protein
MAFFISLNKIKTFQPSLDSFLTFFISVLPCTKNKFILHSRCHNNSKVKYIIIQASYVTRKSIVKSLLKVSYVLIRYESTFIFSNDWIIKLLKRSTMKIYITLFNHACFCDITLIWTFSLKGICYHNCVCKSVCTRLGLRK